MLGLHHSLLRFYTLLILVFFHLHGRRAKLRGILYPLTRSPLTLLYSRCAFTRIFRSYGHEWRWNLSQLFLVYSIPWKAA